MDHIFKTVVSIGGALASYLFGGWSAKIQTSEISALDYLYAGNQLTCLFLRLCY